MDLAPRSLFGVSRKKHRRVWVLDGSALEPSAHTLLATSHWTLRYRQQLEELLFPAQEQHCERFLRDVVSLHERSCRSTVPISSSRHVARLPALVVTLEAFFLDHRPVLHSISAMVLNHRLDPLPPLR